MFLFHFLFLYLKYLYLSFISLSFNCYAPNLKANFLYAIKYLSFVTASFIPAAELIEKKCVRARCNKYTSTLALALYFAVKSGAKRAACNLHTLNFLHKAMNNVLSFFGCCFFAPHALCYLHGIINATGLFLRYCSQTRITTFKTTLPLETNKVQSIIINQ